MPRSAPSKMSANMTPALRAACEQIDRGCDQWFLPNMRRSIMGDVAIYVANPRIRNATLTAVGISTRDHLAVREALRGKLMCERSSPVFLQRLASMLIGERRLSREGTQTMAAKFAPARAA